MLLPQHHHLHSIITAIQGHHRTQDRCTHTELSTTKELCPCSIDGLGGVSRGHVLPASREIPQVEWTYSPVPLLKKVTQGWNWHDFSSTHQALSYLWHCCAGLGSSGSWSSRRLSPSEGFQHCTAAAPAGHMQLVTFSNVEAMNRLGITQTSFLSSPPQFNTTFTVSSHSPSQTTETWVLSKCSVARANQMHVQVCYLYIHKKIESCKHTVLRGDMPHTKDQDTIFLHTLCAGLHSM